MAPLKLSSAGVTAPWHAVVVWGFLQGWIILRSCGRLCKIQLNQDHKENTTKKPKWSKCISLFFLRHVSNFSTRKWLLLCCIQKLEEYLVQQPMMWSDSQTCLKQTPSLKPSLDFACSYQLLQLLYCKWCLASNATLSIKSTPASRFYSFTQNMISHLSFVSFLWFVVQLLIKHVSVSELDVVIRIFFIWKSNQGHLNILDCVLHSTEFSLIGSYRILIILG